MIKDWWNTMTPEDGLISCWGFRIFSAIGFGCFLMVLFILIIGIISGLFEAIL